MITKSGALFVKKQSANQSMLAALTQAPLRQFSGGGPKKPAMNATETDFDVVFVGNYISKLKFHRWSQCHSPREVPPRRWS